jgi:hypothetical protein
MNKTQSNIKPFVVYCAITRNSLFIISNNVANPKHNENKKPTIKIKGFPVGSKNCSENCKEKSKINCIICKSNSHTFFDCPSFC